MIGRCCVVRLDMLAALPGGDIPLFIVPLRGLLFKPPPPCEEGVGVLGVSDLVRATGPEPPDPAAAREALAMDTGTSLCTPSWRWPFCGEAGMERTPCGRAGALDDKADRPPATPRETGGEAPTSGLRVKASPSSDVAEERVVFDIWAMGLLSGGATRPIESGATESKAS